MKKEGYERHVENLEAELDLLRNENERLKEESRIVRATVTAEQERHYRGLLAFLQSMYGQLGHLQIDLLKNISKINGVVLDQSQQRLASLLAGVSESVYTKSLPDNHEEG